MERSDVESNVKQAKGNQSTKPTMAKWLEDLLDEEFGRDAFNTLTKDISVKHEISVETAKGAVNTFAFNFFLGGYTQGKDEKNKRLRKLFRDYWGPFDGAAIPKARPKSFRLHVGKVEKKVTGYTLEWISKAHSKAKVTLSSDLLSLWRMGFNIMNITLQ